jgi:hypothetical protein
VERIPAMFEKSGVQQYVKTVFGESWLLERYILRDMFRHGFDGSGADNFYDAGSCIDGRLTSMWQWCQAIERKPYFDVFLLSGFVGFDGGAF